MKGCVTQLQLSRGLGIRAPQQHALQLTSHAYVASQLTGGSVCMLSNIHAKSSACPAQRLTHTVSASMSLWPCSTCITLYFLSFPGANLVAEHDLTAEPCYLSVLCSKSDCVPEYHCLCAGHGPSYGVWCHYSQYYSRPFKTTVPSLFLVW